MLNAVDTRFKLPAEQVDAVIAAGRDALRVNPKFREFLGIGRGGRTSRAGQQSVPVAVTPVEDAPMPGPPAIGRSSDAAQPGALDALAAPHRDRSSGPLQARGLDSAAAAGAARNGASAFAPPGSFGVGVDAGREHGDALDVRRQRADIVDALDVDQLADLLEADLGFAAGR